MRTKSCLTAADVRKMIAAGVAEAEKNKWKVGVAVVDDAGLLLGFERMDGAPAIASTAAADKARTAALTGQASKVWEDRIKERQAFLSFTAGLLIQGGVPIVHQNECVGAIGVSGVLSVKDEQVALAGLAALG